MLSFFVIRGKCIMRTQLCFRREEMSWRVGYPNFKPPPVISSSRHSERGKLYVRSLKARYSSKETFLLINPDMECSFH